MNELKDLIDLYLSIDNQSDGTWQMFVAVNTAIFGWLISKKGRHDLKARIAGTAAYGVFAFALLVSLDSNASLFEAVAHDLRIVAGHDALFVEGSKIQGELVKVSERTWDNFWKYIYFVSVFSVGAFILWDGLSQAKGSNSPNISTTK